MQNSFAEMEIVSSVKNFNFFAASVQLLQEPAFFRCFWNTPIFVVRLLEARVSGLSCPLRLLTLKRYFSTVWKT